MPAAFITALAGPKLEPEEKAVLRATRPCGIILFALSISFAGSPALSVTHGGTALTRVGARDAPSQDGRVEIWSLVAPAVGNHSVQISLDDSNSTLIAGAASFANVDPAVSFSGASGMAGDPTLSVASDASEVVVGVVMWNGGDYSTLAGNEQTAWNRNSDNLGGCCSIVGAGATSTVPAPTLTWTVGGGFDDFWAVGAVILRPR
jgi:hypothetical protein